MLIEKINNDKYKLTIDPYEKPKDFSFQEHKDKFFYDRSKTIGFRKDKKLSKFVGLRDGYSKQLEFSITSIILDGEELIPKNRVNFNSISLEDNMVKHTINNTILYNEVDDTNFKNMIKIDEPFKSLVILYEVHTKGIKVSNRKSNDRYISNNDQFTFIDDGNRETIFIIDTPVLIDSDGNHHKVINHILYKDGDRLFYKKVIGRTTKEKYKFPLLIDSNIIFNVNLSSSGIGVIESSGTTWDDAKDGTGDLLVVHSSSVGTYGDSIGLQVNSGTSTYILSRTYLNFNTSTFASNTDVLSSVRLKINNYQYNDIDVAIMIGTQSNVLSASDWNEFTTYINGGTLNTGFITEFNIPLELLNLTGNTKFVLISKDYDYTIITPDDLQGYIGIDFSGTKLEVIYETVKVYGQTSINVVKGDTFELIGYTNSGNTATERTNNSEYIQWFRDSGYTEYLGSGSSISLYSMEYEINNNVYAVIPITGGTTYSEPLIITVNIIRLDYATIPDKLIDYDAIDIDSIYFKYQKCMSGVCYTYVRDINSIYEGFPLVSDSWGNESYNLYNEFDIIDEFFSNSHEVDVVYNENLDLTKRYNQLDGEILRQGTRVLLTNQDDVTELGVYVVQFDNYLIRTDEMNTYEDLFRYKAHVRYGSYADQEIHIWPILPPPPPPYIDITPNPVVLSFNTGDTQTVMVLSDTSWVLYKNIPWISISSSEGVGNKTITITTTMQNNTSLSRMGMIEFTGIGVTTILYVVQLQDVGLLRVTTDGDLRITSDGDNRILI